MVKQNVTNISQFVLFTTSLNSDSCTCNLWDYNTGNSLKVYKGGGKAQINSFQQLHNDYFLTADKDKPLLHVWAVNKQEAITDIQTILPKPASALAISPDNGYLTASIDTKLYTWEIKSGLLLSVVEKHLQPITCLKFAGYFLISASESGSVIIFAHSDLISSRARLLKQCEPRYTRKDHTGIITDLYVSRCDIQTFFVTVSTDCTSIVYQVATGEPVVKIVFNNVLSAVVADISFTNLFIGDENGKIFQYYLREAPRTLTDYVSSGSNELSFIGHKKRINCLDVNVKINCLVSGSDDNFIYIWNIYSRSILNTIDLKSPVANARFIMNHNNFYTESLNPQLMLKSLRRDFADKEEEYAIILVDNKYDVAV